jgi:hypothetical protein
MPTTTREFPPTPRNASARPWTCSWPDVPQRSDGRLIKDNLWKEAGLSRATMNRAIRILAEWNTRVAECDGFTPSEARKNDELPLYERNSKTKLVSARSCTIGSTQPLPQSPRCITTTCCCVKNSTDEANSSRYKSTAEPTTLLPRRSTQPAACPDQHQPLIHGVLLP